MCLLTNNESRMGYDPQSCSRSQQVAPVHGDVLPVQILVTRREQDGARHVLILPRSPGRHLLVLLLVDVALLRLVALPGRHLAREDARRDRVDAHLEPVACDLGREQLGQVDGGALAGVVGEVVLRGLGHAGDGGDVDHGAGPALVPLRRLLQQREEGSGQEEEGRHVSLVGRGPVLVGGVRVLEQVLGHVRGGRGVGFLRVGADACVVDENAKARLARGDLGHQGLDVGFGGDVRNQWDDLALDALAVGLTDSLELFLGPPSNVDFSSIDG